MEEEVPPKLVLEETAGAAEAATVPIAPVNEKGLLVPAIGSFVTAAGPRTNPRGVGSWCAGFSKGKGSTGTVAGNALRLGLGLGKFKVTWRRWGRGAKGESSKSILGLFFARDSRLTHFRSRSLGSSGLDYATPATDAFGCPLKTLLSISIGAAVLHCVVLFTPHLSIVIAALGHLVLILCVA